MDPRLKTNQIGGLELLVKAGLNNLKSKILDLNKKMTDIALLLLFIDHNFNTLLRNKYCVDNVLILMLLFLKI